MKKFILHIVIFFAIVAAVDIASGKVFRFIQAKAGGRTGAEFYACEKATEDIIIMGSSRASHHYVPEIIFEKLGMSCFNAGQDGNGIILQYGRWKMISERYTPKLLIYDVSSGFDLADNDNMTYVDRLKPFCSNNSVKNYVATLFPMENIKTLSQMYCFNYKFIEMASDCLRDDDFLLKAGYIPLYGHIRDEVVNKVSAEKESSITTDNVKLFYLEQLIKEANGVGVKVVFVVSPTWKGGYLKKEAYSVISAMADKYGVPFIDYIESDICDNPDYFEDSSHLNDKGARAFTEDFVSHIQI